VNLPDLRQLVISLVGEMLFMAGISETSDEGERMAAARLDDGSALLKFGEMVSAQGGNPEVCDRYELLPAAPLIMDILSPEQGVVKAIDTRAIGMASVELGAGRRVFDDSIDHAVGFEIYAKIGDRIEKKQPLGRVHARNDSDALEAIESVRRAYIFTEDAVSRPNLIIRRLPE